MWTGKEAELRLNIRQEYNITKTWENAIWWLVKWVWTRVKCPARKATTSTTLVLSAIHLLLLQEMKLHKHCTQKMPPKTLVSCTHSNSEGKWSFLKYLHSRRSYACKKYLHTCGRGLRRHLLLRWRRDKTNLCFLISHWHAYREKLLCTCINLPKRRNHSKDVTTKKFTI